MKIQLTFKIFEDVTYFFENILIIEKMFLVVFCLRVMINIETQIFAKSI